MKRCLTRRVEAENLVGIQLECDPDLLEASLLHVKEKLRRALSLEGVVLENLELENFLRSQREPLHLPDDIPDSSAEKPLELAPALVLGAVLENSLLLLREQLLGPESVQQRLLLVGVRGPERLLVGAELPDVLELTECLPKTLLVGLQVLGDLVELLEHLDELVLLLEGLLIEIFVLLDILVLPFLMLRLEVE